MTKQFLGSFAATLFSVLTIVSTGFPQTSPSKEFPGVKIKNFGQMDERFFRGAQPKKGQYEALKDLGVQTIIDLREKPKGYAKAEVEALGMRYVNIPIIDKAYPTEENIASFLKVLDDPETGVFFAHCKGGRHRTGDVGAVYRSIKNGWSFDRAYLEMKNYDFYSSWGHGKQKDFVIDYFVKADQQRAQSAPATKKGGN